MARFDERAFWRNDNERMESERDEHRYGERGRWGSDWDRDRYREAPEYGRAQSYGWARESRDFDLRTDPDRRARDNWRSGENPASRANEPWGSGSEWRSGGRPADYDRYSHGGEGRSYGQYGQAYGTPRFGDDYGPNESRQRQQRWNANQTDQGHWNDYAGRTTLRGIGSASDDENSGSAFQGWSRHAHDAGHRGGFAGKGPRGYTRSDDRIREDVCDRLSADDEVDASDITVTVAKGEVTLEGSVQDRHCKRRAEDIAESVTGVNEVHNRLRSNKGLMQEVGDKIMGREPNDAGHAGSGTRNAPAGTPTHQNSH